MTLWLVTGGCGFIGSHLCAALDRGGAACAGAGQPVLRAGGRTSLPAPDCWLATWAIRRCWRAPWKVLTAASTLPPSLRWSGACANGAKRTG